MERFTISLTGDERQALLDLLTDELQRSVSGDRLALKMAYGRISQGDSMTLDESRKLLPEGWYISYNARGRPSRDGVPITSKQYAGITNTAIRQRAEALSR